MLTDSDITALKNYFETRKDIVFAFLFGSQARRTATKLSDVDIAVYFHPEKRHPVEYEEDVFYEGEDKIWADMGNILNKEVELLVLNRVSSSVAASAVRGVPLAINDWGLYIDFVEVIMDEAENFMDFVINEYLEKTAVEKGS